MIPWLKRLFNDEAAFELWWRRAKLTARGGLLALAMGMQNGTITWPAWMPPWAITGIAFAALAIGVGQNNTPAVPTADPPAAHPLER